MEMASNQLFFFLTAGGAQRTWVVLYSYFATFVSVCLSVCPYKVWGGLGKSQWDGSWHMWLVQRLSSAEAQLSLHKRIIAKEPKRHGNAKKPATNYAGTS